ncbi:hypothetical protein OROHE_013154 [Orobanche hederae]
MISASTINPNSIQINLNFDFNLLKFSSVTCHKNVAGRFILRRSRSLLSVHIGSAARRRNPIPLNYPTITWARRTERDQEASTSLNASAKEVSRFRSPEAIDSDESLCDDTSGAISGETASSSSHYATSLRTVGICVFSAVTFGVGLGFKDGVCKASEFFAGNRVLSYGIAGAVVFRLSLILLGTATLQRFEAVNLLLATVLLYSSFKLFAEDDEDSDLSDNFIVKTCQKFIPVISNYDGNRFITTQDGVWKATPLLLTVAVIELSDIAFAVDSIPAVLGVTRDPFIVFSSNLFAILGLRSYYTLISESMSDLEYLQPAIGVVLGFIGCKMILEFFGLHISTEVSLGLVATSLTSGVLLSLIKRTDRLKELN